MSALTSRLLLPLRPRVLAPLLARAQSGGGVPRPPPTSMDSLLDVGSRDIFDEDHDLFRESTRRFMRDELAPLQADFEAQGQPTKEIWRKLGQQGLLGVAVSAEEGGQGGTFKHEAIVHEEQTYAHCFSPNVIVHSTICLPYLINYGSEEQRQRYVPEMVAGSTVAAIAMTEPDAGSDLQGIRTTAVADGDDFVINGSKVFISNGILADVVILAAVTDPGAKSKAHGISLFLVDSDMAGFKRGQNLKKIGLKAQDTAELFFEDVRLPKTQLLGGLNRGFYQLMNELPQERLAIALQAVAHAEWMFETTREYVLQRKAFGGTIASLQTVQHKLAELKTAIAVSRAFLDQCTELHEHKACSNEMASMAKYWATDLESKVATECLQLHGGWGYMWEQQIARSFVNARVQTIYGGCNEVMKELIARNITGKLKK